MPSKEPLPKSVYLKHGAYFYVKENVWHRLGKAWDKEAKEKWASLSSPTPHASSVAFLLDSYLAYCVTRVKAGTLRAATLQYNRVEAANLKLFFGKMDAKAVLKKHIALYLDLRTDKQGNPAPIRANREISLLSAAYSYGIRKTWLENNPCFGVPKNKEQPRTRHATSSERRQFSKRCCPDWLRAYLLIKYLTGLRMGDMLRLNDSCESARGIQVRLGKSRSGKVLEFRWTWALRVATRFAKRVAASRIHERQDGGHQYYFSTGGGDRLTASGFKSAWVRAMRKWTSTGGIRFRENDIRASAYTAHEERGNSGRKLLGHTTEATGRRHYQRGVEKVSPVR